MEFDKNLIGGSTVLLILSLLEKTDRYGYEIIRELELRSDKAFQLKEGTIYPVLHKLENDGYVKSYKAEGERGRARKYYKITKNGIKQLSKEKEKWSKFSISVNKVIGGELYESN
jgi:DNA-binding PadR family transcriptional regulator